MMLDRAADLVTSAEYIGMSRAIAARIQRDIQDLRVSAPQVVGADLDPQLKALTASIGKVVDRLDRASIDAHRETMSKEARR